MIKRPKTVNEYVSLVDQALDEIFELRAAAEYDADSMGSLPFLDDLEEGVRRLKRSMEQGDYQFANEDLPFMGIVEKADDRLLPFKFLFHMINETHRKGLDVDEIS